MSHGVEDASCPEGGGPQGNKPRATDAAHTSRSPSAEPGEELRAQPTRQLQTRDPSSQRMQLSHVWSQPTETVESQELLF